MIGDVLGNYRIEREIGRGGMGVVYAAQHTLLGRTAAVKVLLPKYSREEDIVQRFFNEARAAAAIKHPGIVEIYDFGHASDGSAYIVMELCDGESLARRARRPLTIAAALTIVRQIAGTLAAAHRAGIIHRDLKPDNVFVVPDPDVSGGERIKLLDFGIAKLAHDSEGGSNTATGAILGTPNYMSPEQCRGAGQVDPRSDLYSLGVMLFELVLGRLPFSGEGPGDIVAAHVHLAPPSPRSIAPDVPADLDQLVLRLLAKNPADRPDSADAVVADIDRLLQVIRPSLPAVARTADAVGFAATTPSGEREVLAPTAPSEAPAGEIAARARKATPRRWPWFAGAAGLAVAAIAAFELRGGGPPPRALIYDFAGDIVEVLTDVAKPTLDYVNNKTSGKFDKSSIRSAISARRPAFGYCYGRRPNPTNGGLLTLSFTVERDGTVISSSIDDPDRELAACINGYVTVMQFPKPPAEVHVTYPLKFLIAPPAH